MSPWEQGRASVEALLAQGKLERVPANDEAAAALLVKARTHLTSADALADTDVELAYDGLHSANRKALTAALLVQGLRPTRAGGHTAVYDAVRAQLHPPLGPVLSPYTRIRRARNAGDYLDELPAQSDDVRADLVLCRAIVDVITDVLGELPRF